jgi:superfamily II DNA helicase RecQ
LERSSATKKRKYSTHDQAGHTDATAHRNYAITNFNHPKLSTLEIGNYRQDSYEWDVLLTKFADFEIIVPATQSTSSSVVSTPASTKSIAIVPATQTICSVQQPNPSFQPTEQRSEGILLAALRKLLQNNQARFKNNDQLLVMEQVLYGSGNTLIIQPTGSGKSFSFILCPLIEISKVTIVVTPFVALNADLQHTLSKFKVPYQVFSADMRNTDLSPGNLLFVSPFMLGTDGFRNCFNYWINVGLVSRVVIDEIHEFLFATEYRVDLGNVTNIFSKQVRVIMMSATLPPEKELSLVRLTNSTSFTTCRFPTTRPNLKYIVDFVEHRNIHNALLEYLNRFAHNPNTDRVIIYVQTVKEVDNITTMLRDNGFKCYGFHGKMEHAIKVEMKRLWESKGLIMVATSGFGTGIDYQTIPLLFIVGSCYSLLDYGQMTGRAGRDGRISYCITITSAEYLAKVVKSYDTDRSSMHATDEAFKMNSFLRSSNCYRQQLGEYLDGYGRSCLSQDKHTVLCGNCEKSTFD